MKDADRRRLASDAAARMSGSRATQGEAKRNLFVDDDELPEMKLGGRSSAYVDFYATVDQNMVKVWSEVQDGKFALDKGWAIGKVTVMGLGVSDVFSNVSEQVYSEDSDVDGEMKSVMV